MDRRHVVVRSCIAAAAALAIVFCAPSGYAQEGWTISGSFAERDGETGGWVLPNVMMENEVESILVEGQLVHYFPNEERAEFVESVRVTQNSSVIVADSGFFDMEGNTGSFVGSVSLVRSASEENEYEIRLTCDELSLNASTDSFVAKGNPVMERIDNNGEEVVLRADLIEYEGDTRVVRLIGNATMSTSDMRISGKKIVFNTQTEAMELTDFVIELLSSSVTETE